MSDATVGPDIDLARWLVGGALATVLGFVVLLWPGPVSITDRLPFALVLILPGTFALYHGYAEATAPV
ncbi:MAG: hypothetical protein ABEH88_01170 [Halobacteriales archaeon]